MLRIILINRYIKNQGICYYRLILYGSTVTFVGPLLLVSLQQNYRSLQTAMAVVRCHSRIPVPFCCAGRSLGSNSFTVHFTK